MTLEELSAELLRIARELEQRRSERAALDVEIARLEAAHLSLLAQSIAAPTPIAVDLPKPGTAQRRVLEALGGPLQSPRVQLRPVEIAARADMDVRAVSFALQDLRCRRGLAEGPIAGGFWQIAAIGLMALRAVLEAQKANGPPRSYSVAHPSGRKRASASARYHTQRKRDGTAQDRPEQPSVPKAAG